MMSDGTTLNNDSDYFPFGGERIATTSNVNPHYKFTGKEIDPEDNLLHFLARDYSSRLGRFMSPDPLAGDVSNPQSLNRYAYVNNNPLNFTDPSGQLLAVIPTDFSGLFSLFCGGLACFFHPFQPYIPPDVEGGNNGRRRPPTPPAKPPQTPAKSAPCTLTPKERAGLVGAGILNFLSAGEKFAAAAAAGIAAPATEGVTLPGAFYEGLTASPTAVTGEFQIAAGFTGNPQFATGATATSAFTSISGPITLVRTRNIQSASAASTIESIFTFGLSGSINPVSLGNLINDVTSVVFGTSNSSSSPCY